MTAKQKHARFISDLRRVVKLDHQPSCQCHACLAIAKRVREVAKDADGCKLCLPCMCQELAASGHI
jgi:hypothetical protein